MSLVGRPSPIDSADDGSPGGVDACFFEGSSRVLADNFLFSTIFPESVPAVA